MAMGYNGLTKPVLFPAASAPYTLTTAGVTAVTCVSGQRVPMGCREVRLVNTGGGGLAVRVGNAVTAVVTDFFLPAGWPERFLVNQNDSVSIIRTGGTDSTCSVSYMTS